MYLEKRCYRAGLIDRLIEIGRCHEKEMNMKKIK
jgi:hypothetical protein